MTGSTNRLGRWLVCQPMESFPDLAGATAYAKRHASKLVHVENGSDGNATVFRIVGHCQRKDAAQLAAEDLQTTAPESIIYHVLRNGAER